MDKPFALIVEDNGDIVTLFQHVLDMAGYQTEIVMDGTEAMERISTTHPDIVLLDLQLPGMTGVEILKQMRTHDELAAIPVVVITAYQNYSARLPFEPDLLLLKPVNIYQLSNLVQHLQATRGKSRETAYDPITGLYTLAYFDERLALSMEHIAQAAVRRFGILFAEIIQIEELKKRLKGRELDKFQHRLADQFKSTLRPTDITAWSSKDGCFLALIEEIPTPEATVKIAERVHEGFTGSFETQDPGFELRVNIGVLICDVEYKEVQKIMEDLQLARNLLRSGSFSNPAVFDHKVILTQK